MIIQQTADGSHTLYLPEIDETYHSVHGAENESQHVFLEAGFNQCAKNELNILEVGFGTGLNAYLTALESVRQDKIVHYTTIERFPLHENFWRQLNFAREDKENQLLFEKIHSSVWEEKNQITNHFYLQKIQADFCDLYLKNSFDVIYYDAFSPEKQPKLWTEAIFEKLYNHTKPQGILTTYCAKGSVRRTMQKAGYQVERLPGPVGKREMLRAVRL